MNLQPVYAADLPPGSNACRRMRLWLLLCFVTVIACTLAPFDSPVPRSQLPERLAQTLKVEISPGELVGHCASFFVLGVLVANAYAGSLRSLPTGMIVLGALLFCGGLEFVQLFQPARHARVNDVVVNTLSLTAGLLLIGKSRMGAPWQNALARASTRPPYFEIFLVTTTLVVWWVIGLQPAFGALRLNWDPTFPLIVGNETGGARPWLGQLQYLGIYDRALDGTDARNLDRMRGAEGDSKTRLNSGLLVDYDFRAAMSGKSESAGSLNDQQLCLTVPTDWLSSSGLTTSRTGLAQSHGPAASLVKAIERSGAFSIEVVMDPQDLHEVGPARVISNSLGPAKRNFTLGQSEADLVFRVRNNINGENGHVYELTAPGIVDANGQHIVAAYDHGVSTIFKNGSRWATVDLREPMFYSGLATGSTARAALVSLAVLGISVPTWFILERVFPAGRARVTSVLLTALAGLAPYLISCWIIGGPVRFSFPIVYTVALFVLFPLALWFVSTSPDAPS